MRRPKYGDPLETVTPAQVAAGTGVDGGMIISTRTGYHSSAIGATWTVTPDLLVISFRRAITRLDDGRPAGPLGVLIDALAKGGDA